MIFLFYFCIIVQLLIVDCRIKSTQLMAKSNGYNEFYIVVYKTVMILIFNIFTTKKYEIVTIIIYLLCSILLFEKVNKNMIYQNIKIYKVVLVQVSINTWTAYMIVFQLITKDILFDAGIYAWILGTMVITFLVVIKKEYRFDILLMNSNRLQTAKKYVLQLEYLIKLLRYYETDKYVSNMMDGIIDYHKTICQRSDCPSRKKFVKTKKFQRIFNKDTDTETIIQLIHMIDSFYLLGLTKFPMDKQLRISHALFLLDKFQQKQQALQELMILENQKLTFDQEFILMRFKILIEQEIIEEYSDEKQQAANLLFQQNINEITYIQYINKLKKAIDVSTHYHMDFWSQLREDIPDLDKVQEVGEMILSCNKIIYDNWNYLQNMNVSIPFVQKLYSNYCQLVINDKTQADLVLSRIRNYNNQNINFKQNNEGDISQQADPLIFISAEEENLGTVTNINLSASSILSYSKAEVINKKINGFMPNMYSQFHDSFIEHYLQTYEAKILNKETLFPFKNKMNYICLVHMVISITNTLVNGVQFQGHIKLDKLFRNICYILIEKDEGKIENISSSCINLLGLNIQKVTKTRTIVTDILPNFFIEINEYLGKQGIISKVNTNFEDDDQCQVKLMQVVAIPIRFYQQGLQGYLIRFEMLKDHISDERMNQFIREQQLMSQQTQNRKQFMMKYDAEKSAFQGCLKEDNIKINQDGLIIKNSADHMLIGDLMSLDMSQININDSICINKLKQNYEEKMNGLNEKRVDQIDYGVGIRIMRLFGGRVIDIEDFKRIESDEEEDNNANGQMSIKDNIKIEELSDEEEIENMNIFKTRKGFQEFIDERISGEIRAITSTLYSSMVGIRFLGQVFLLIYFILGILNFILIDNELNNTIRGYDLVYKSGRRQSLIQICLFSLIQISQLKNDWLSISNDPIKKQNYFRKQINYLDSYVEKLQGLQNELLQKGNLLNNRNLKRLMQSNVVDIHSLELGGSVVRQYDVNEATKQIISKILEIKTMPIERFAISSDNYYFLHFNMLNDYALATSAVTQLYINELEKMSSLSSLFESIFFVFSFVIITVVMTIMLLVYKMVTKIQTDIMKVFLEIPIVQIKILYQQVDDFNNSMNVGEDDQNSNYESSENNQENEEDTFLKVGMKKNRRERKSKVSNKYRISFAIIMFIVIIFIQTYFISDYIFSYNYQQLQYSAVQELNITSNIEHELSFMSNLISNHITTPNIQVYGIYTNYVIPQQNAKLYLYISALETMHMNNRHIMNQQYQDTFSTVMKKGVCDIFVNILKTKTKEECKTFSYGIVDQGISIALSNQVQNYEYMLQLIQYYTNKLESPYLHNDEGDELLVKTNNKTLNNFIQALDSSRGRRSLILQQEYFFPIFEYLGAKFIDVMQMEFDQLHDMRLNFLIIYCFVLVFLYFGFLNPIIFHVSQQISNAKKMTIIIPSYLVIQNKNIRRYIQTIIQEKE